MKQDRKKPDPLPPTAVLSQRRTTATEDGRDFTLHDPALDYFERLGQYSIRAEIARGGMGVIFKAYDEELHRDVAIKLLPYRFARNPSFCQRFVNEALLTSRLQHPCIVPIYDCGLAADQRPYFAMKLVGGHSLGQILSVLPESENDRSRLLKIFEQVCLALSYAHTNDVLHLDLKPANVMVGEFGEVHVMDWGLARTWSSSAPQKTPPGSPMSPRASIVGTAAYMAPEQARGEDVCPRTDVFGLGALLCEILTGRPPHRGHDHRRLHARAMQGDLADAIRCLDDSDSDRRLVDLAKQCLSPDRNHRPTDAKSVGECVANYLESALRQAESDLCRFFDLSPDLFCIATLDGFFKRLNTNFPRVLGYTEEHLISRPFLDFVHSEDVAQTMVVMQGLAVGTPVVRFCNRYRHADGHYIRLEWTARAIVEEGVIFAVARDVTRVGI